MSFNLFRTGMPCLVEDCGQVIESWTAGDRAVPCGHSWDEITAAVKVEVILLEARRVEFGQYVMEVSE